MNKIVKRILNELKRDVFVDSDVTTLLNDSNDTKYSLMKRAISSGDVIRLKRGVYCLSKEYQRYGINLWHISQVLYGPSCVSLESALSYHGWIPEGVFSTTCASMKRSVSYENVLGTFVYHCVPLNNFYRQVKRIESLKESFFMASPLKALCDYVYVYKKDWNSIAPLVQSLRIDEDVLGQISLKGCNELLENYKSKRVKRFIRGLKKELCL
ncbi:MAG: hypothetical protein P9X22_08155 [Candidatus Zapsychrus exili]|nr:hypothetical protein [Candidatus Zapsychrus exili]